MSALLAMAEDFKTINGKEYKNVEVSRVEPDGIVLKAKSGISKVYFTELPKETQEKFNYDPQKAADYSRQQNAALEEVQKQQEKAAQQKAEETQKANQRSAQQGQLQVLQGRYNELQSQENDLQLRIEQANQRGPTHWVGTTHRIQVQDRNPLVDQLPSLNRELLNVRREKSEIRKQLNAVQR